jgi:hypothetical protein
MTSDLSESQLTALAVRELALAIIAHGEAEAELQARHANDPTMTTDLWYERYCLELSQIVQVAAGQAGLDAKVVCGLLIGPKYEGRYPRPWQHAWLEVEDGTIIDPSSAQYELPDCLIVPPSGDLYRHYRMRGWWKEGDGDKPPEVA